MFFNGGVVEVFDFVYEDVRIVEWYDILCYVVFGCWDWVS